MDMRDYPFPLVVVGVRCCEEGQRRVSDETRRMEQVGQGRSEIARLRRSALTRDSSRNALSFLLMLDFVIKGLFGYAGLFLGIPSTSNG